jgi:hypothetical protein
MISEHFREFIKRSVEAYRDARGLPPTRMMMNATTYLEFCKQLGCSAVTIYYGMRVIINANCEANFVHVDRYPCL